MYQDSSRRLSRLPRHLGIIPDGTRRWAAKYGTNHYSAYSRTFDHLVECIDHCYRNGVTMVSVYLLSKENLLQRQTSNLASIFGALESTLRGSMQVLITKWQCAVQVAGRYEHLPATLVDGLQNAQAYVPANGTRPHLYLLVGYNPVDEILFALSASERPEEFTSKLWVTESVDLVIRTAGVCLLSNFLPLQSGYAQLWVTERYFNDLTLDDIETALREFAGVVHKHGA